MPDWTFIVTWLLILVSWVITTFKEAILSFFQDWFKDSRILRRELRLINHKDKIRLYQETIKTLSAVVNGLENMDANSAWGNEEAQDRFMQLVYPIRIQTIASISLFAPDSVVHACTDFMNYIFLCCRGDLEYSNDTLTDLGDIFLNEIRKDIGIGKAQITFDTDGLGQLEDLQSRIQKAAECRVARI